MPCDRRYFDWCTCRIFCQAFHVRHNCCNQLQLLMRLSKTGKFGDRSVFWLKCGGFEAGQDQLQLSLFLARKRPWRREQASHIVQLEVVVPMVPRWNRL